MWREMMNKGVVGTVDKENIREKRDGYGGANTGVHAQPPPIGACKSNANQALATKHF